MIKTTLKENGPRLPIGIVVDGKVEKTFNFRTFKAKIERHLGNWKEGAKDTHSPGQLIAMQVPKLLSLLVTRIGSSEIQVDNSGDSLPQSELIFYQAYFADIMYMYLYLRSQTLGTRVRCPVSCDSGKCSYSGMAEFDLSETSVNIAEDLKEVYQWVTLQRPFKLRDQKTLCSKVKVGPVTWSTMTKPGIIGGSIGTIELATLQDAICAVNGSDTPYHFTDEDIDEMEKIDRVRIDRIAAKSHVGVDLNVTISCPKCRAPIVNPLNWEYENFFGSSLPLETLTS